MIVGIPKEIKAHEYRVGILPVGVETLVAAGHRVLVEAAAGVGSGILDADYQRNGAEIAKSADQIYAQSDLIMKVKEPQAQEFDLLRDGQAVFTYLHFAADRPLTEAMLQRGITAVAYETIADDHGGLPLLVPMSEVAGRMSIQEGAKYLEKPTEGRGILLGGVPGVMPAKVVILGGGIVGSNAAKVAAGLGANVMILDINVDRLRYLDDIMPANVTTLYSDRHTILSQIATADLVIGAVLIPGALAPRLLTAADLKRMKPGSVIVDVAIDQGGCLETSRPTTHGEPIFIEEGVVHYCVTNMPGAVGRTSTFALCNVTLPFAREMAGQGVLEAAKDSAAVASGINTHKGQLTNQAVAEAHDLAYTPLAEIW